MAAIVDRTRQHVAVRCHSSQAVPGSVLWRRLDLLGDREHLRWVHGFGPGPTEHQFPVQPATGR